MELVKSGIIRSIVAIVIASQLTLIALCLGFSIYDAARGYFYSSNYVSAMFVMNVLLGAASLTIGTVMGTLIGGFLNLYKQGTANWLAAVVGGLIPLLSALSLTLLISDLRDEYFFSYITVVCLACAVVGWQLNADLLRQTQLTAFQVSGTNEIVSYILRAQQGWNSSRYNIDNELLQRGYDPAEIEAAWVSVASGNFWLDANGDLHIGKPPSQRPIFGLLDGITGSHAIAYLTAWMFVSLFLTQFIFIPAFIATYLLLAARRQRLTKKAGIVV
jgi:hypothetical protein